MLCFYFDSMKSLMYLLYFGDSVCVCVYFTSACMHKTDAMVFVVACIFRFGKQQKGIQCKHEWISGCQNHINKNKYSNKFECSARLGTWKKGKRYDET